MREENDAERRREEDGCGRARMASGQAAAEPVGGDGGEDRGCDRRQARPVLGVVPPDDRVEESEVPRSCWVVRQRTLDHVREGALGGCDRGGLPDVERAAPERDDPEHERQPRPEVGECAVEHGQHACLQGDRPRGGRGVGPGAHPNRG